MMQKKRDLFPILTFMLAIGSFACCNQISNKTFHTKSKECWMTVFVHGAVTHLIRKAGPTLLLDLFKDRIKGTRYEKATRHIRNDSFFEKDQAMKGLGLKKINMASRKPGDASAATAVILDQVDEWCHGKRSCPNRYYTYGWSGLISIKTREKESESFYNALKKELAHLKAQGISPKIRLIGFSHGGSIVANLGLIQPKKDPDLELIVHELILIGMPIYDQLTDMISNPMFKKVYNIYSLADRVQRLDLTLPGTLFPRRIFINNKKTTMPDNLIQLRIKMSRNRTTKKKWKKENDPRRKFDRKSISLGYSNLLRKSSPGHVEFWFFDWVRQGYRDNFPIKPLPAIALLPRILQIVEQHGNNEKRLIVDLRPHQETFLLKTKKNQKALPLISEKKLKKLKQLAYKFRVKKITNKENNKRIKTSVRKAVKELKKERRKKKLARAQ